MLKRIIKPNMLKSKSAIKKQVEAFNKKFKPGDKVEYKTSTGTATGILAVPAVAQETQGSMYLKGDKGKVSLDNVVSKN